MIIGISGKMGSGKDTVGQIIQWLTLPDHDMADIHTFMVEYSSSKWDTKWEIKKFGGKLKEIVCLLIGCTMEDLEDQEFKVKELGEEWTKYRLDLDFGDYHDHHYYSTREEAEAQYGKTFTDEIDDDEVDVNMAYVISHGIEEEVMTPRKLLQLLGTECGRDIIHPNAWVNALMSGYELYSPDGTEYINLGQAKDEGWVEYPDWIITDVRFPNEVGVIERKEGILLRVNTDRAGVLSDHSSETLLDDKKDWYAVIDNNGTIDELVVKVKKILIELGVI